MRERGRFKNQPHFSIMNFFTFSLIQCCDVVVYTSTLRVEVRQIQSCCALIIVFVSPWCRYAYAIHLDMLHVCNLYKLISLPLMRISERVNTPFDRASLGLAYFKTIECFRLFSAMTLLTLCTAYAIGSLCIFGNNSRGTLRRLPFLHIAPAIRRSFVYISRLFTIVLLCCLQRIWRGRLPGVC